MEAPPPTGSASQAAPGTARAGRLPRGRALKLDRTWRYRARHLLLRPNAARWRRKLGPDPDPYAKAVLELHTYSPGIVDFVRATAANADILTDAELDASSVVVDVGAYVGEWSERVVERYSPTLYAFEPNPNAFRELTRRLGGSASVELFEVGLGAADGSATLDLALGPGATIHGGAPSTATAEVEIRDVVAMLTELDLDHIDLMKINIEGAEFDLIDRLLDEGWLARIDVLSVQFHEWHPDAHRRRRRIRRRLRETHDETWNYPWVWELWSRRDATGDQNTRGTVSPG